MLVTLPASQGEFELYFGFTPDKEAISDYWYLAIQEKNLHADRLLADARVLLGRVPTVVNYHGAAHFRFVIATNDDLAGTKKAIIEQFNKMTEIVGLDKKRKNAQLEIWDKAGLLKMEKALGIFL